MIDTLKAAKKLIASGFDEGQAQSIVDIVNTTHEELATKGDIGVLRRDMDVIRKDIDVVRQDIDVLRQDIDVIRKDITSLRWLIGISLLLNTLAISGIIAILIAL